MTALSNDQPYPGLRPFDSGDEDFFFGRDAQTRGLREKLRASRLVAVVGRSGCGKSSLVKAGLVPLLRKELDADGQPCWHIASFRPQGQPIAELTDELLRLASKAQSVPVARGPQGPESAANTAESKLPPAEEPALKPEAIAELRRGRLDAMLRRSSQGLVEAAAELALPTSASLLVIIDQFEEIFRFEDPSGKNADEATAFVRLLMEAITAHSVRIHVILTMRLDFLGDCARFARLPEAISDGQYLVPNLSRAERRAAIEEPAKKARKPIKPEVTQRLLNEIGEDPDQLPVLQHVLMRMWQHAGTNAEITLNDYGGTGGVKEAISRHADQIYDALPGDAHRLAAERLFKAISERDRRGRSIRRATTFGEIAGIVAGDEESAPAGAGARKLLDVIEAFREPNCCFVMPPAGEDLVPSTLIDISHESLLRGWSKLTGAPGNEGWIAEEVSNGRKYNDLLEDEKRHYVFPSEIADERQQWWRTTRPNAAWAERYGNKFAAVKDFLEGVCDLHRREAEIRRNRAIRAQRWRLATAVLGTLLVTAGLMFVSSYAARQQAQIESERARVAAEGEEKIAQEKIRLAREYSAKLDQAQLDIQAQKSQLDQLRRDVSQTVEQVQKTVPVNDRQVHQDLNNLVKSSTVVSDATAQRAIVDLKSDAPTTLADNTTGFMWIGSLQRTNLNSLVGAPVLPNAVKAGEQYLNNLDIYLRQGLPTPDYIQQATVGVMPEGTRVQVLSVAPPFSRPTGDQYWAQVRVVSLALSTVYFQFAGGSRDQAQQVSKALQDKGYKIPGEERTRDAKDKHEVRYFYAGQKTVATQLATDTTQALQKLGYPSLSVSAVFAGDPTKSNPDGKPELWLEIPPK
jgi:energy-coupling factor transporter ATP-binding protein EcfA2